MPRFAATYDAGPAAYPPSATTASTLFCEKYSAQYPHDSRHPRQNFQQLPQRLGQRLDALPHIPLSKSPQQPLIHRPRRRRPNQFHRSHPAAPPPPSNASATASPGYKCPPFRRRPSLIRNVAPALDAAIKILPAATVSNRLAAPSNAVLPIKRIGTGAAKTVVIASLP